ncbi:oxidoreductase nitrogenase component 1 [Clostridium polyendosporum]|uniref:Oxidoreductase nitrogenase component 1 n=1 Tax=Clostridium polyendosporum TaxID=69208 RepID=A0A919VN17_9CLOT|nr:nitrogenase component 1 [Clostridium polyendosporum]GIM30138.1 oxidoreductase nitrogenase component 1 [Clostridium polyendosporum]
MSSFIERPRYLCSLGGALSTVTALPDTIPILHAASGCAGNITWTQNGGSGLQVGGYCGGLSVPSSNVQEREVVFGGDSRLREQVENTLEIMDGKLYIVVTGCVTEVIGDDVRAVVSEFKDEGFNIISAETGGFKGNSYYGYDLVLQALIKDFLVKNTPKVKHRVNIFGIVPYMDVFWRGNLEGIRQLLEKFGLEVNTFFTVHDNLENIKDAGSAELNIIVSDVYGVEAAETFKEVHGTPYITTQLPIGPSATNKFLRVIANALSISEEVIEKFINKENKIYYRYLEPLTEIYNDLDLQRYAIIIGDANYSPAITKFLFDDLGWIPKLVVITDQLDEEEKEKLINIPKNLEIPLNPKVVFETDTSEVLKHFNTIYLSNENKKYKNTFSPGFVIGSSLDRGFAQQVGAAHLSISFPVSNRAVIDRGYTGYSGGLRLIEDLLSSIISGR